MYSFLQLRFHWQEIDKAQADRFGTALVSIVCSQLRRRRRRQRRRTSVVSPPLSPPSLGGQSIHAALATPHYALPDARRSRWLCRRPSSVRYTRRGRPPCRARSRRGMQRRSINTCMENRPTDRPTELRHCARRCSLTAAAAAAAARTARLPAGR